MTGSLRAIVLAHGTAPARRELDASWPGWDAGVGLVVAADGGARLAPQLGLRIDRWIGDGDSLGIEGIDGLRGAGVVTTLARLDKDESDTELAVLEAVAANARDITIVGGLGGRRLDHALANIWLLAHPALAGRSARLIDATTRISLLVAESGDDPDAATPTRSAGRFDGRIGDLVSLLPMSAAVDHVVTDGLRFALADETLQIGPARGLSNVRTAPTATISIGRGRLLVVETPASLTP